MFRKGKPERPYKGAVKIDKSVGEIYFLPYSNALTHAHTHTSTTLQDFRNRNVLEISDDIKLCITPSRLLSRKIKYNLAVKSLYWHHLKLGHEKWHKTIIKRSVNKINKYLYIGACIVSKKKKQIRRVGGRWIKGFFPAEIKQALKARDIFWKNIVPVIC
jgi:hypothetical protein